MNGRALPVVVASLLLVLGCGGDADPTGPGTTTPPTTFTIGGTVSGLSGTLVLQNGGGDDLSVSTDGSFTFATALADGGAFAVTVLTQPTGLPCTVSNGSSTVAGSDVTNIAIACGGGAGTFDLSAGITSLVFDPSAQTHVIDVTVTNGGSAVRNLSIDGFVVDFYPATETEPTAGAGTPVPLSVDAGMLPAGGSRVFSFTVSSIVPTSGTAYTVVDPAGVVTEADETDNVSRPRSWPGVEYVSTDADLPVDILDYDDAISSFDVLGAPTSIGNIVVTIDVTHTFLGDLYVSLIAPDGTEIFLIDTYLGGCDDFGNTVFDDAASTPITSSSCVGNASRGTFQPWNPLSGFAGKDANGTWQLVVEDGASGDEGTINAWWLTIR